MAKMSTRTGSNAAADATETTGIRAEVVVTDPDCPIAAASEETDRITEVKRSTASSREDGIVEEFTVEGDVPTNPRLSKVFDFGERSVYHLSRERDRGCVCEVVESFDCVVSDVRAENGCLRVSFYAPDAERIREITDALDAECGNVSLSELTRSSADIEDLIFVDGNRLTDRQKEVVRTAYEMGYFEHPKQANASEVADALGIAPSTFSQHLSAAEAKILDGFFG